MSKVAMQQDNDQLVTSVDEKEIGALEALWSFFSSMKTAIALLLILAAGSIAGTVIEDRTGTSIYGSSWYSMLLVLVGANLLVCSLNRFKMAWRKTFFPDAANTPESVARMTRSERFECAGTPDAVEQKVRRVLKSRAYVVADGPDGSHVALYGARGRAGIWGPHLTHISLLVIFAGGILGHFTGSDGFTTIMEGKRAVTYSHINKGDKSAQPKEEKVPLGFEVGLRNFTIKYDKKHNPVGYKSDLEVFDGGKSVAHKVVDVNHPLSYKGMSFYQSDYGLVGLMVKVTGPDGSVLQIPYNISTQDTEEGRQYTITDQAPREIDMGGKTLTLFVHNLVPDFIGGEQVNGSMLPLNPAVNVMVNDRFPQYKGLDAWGKLGWMTVGKSASFKGYTVSLEKVVSYTGLQVAKDPGLPIVYVGFAMMVLGVVLSFYVAHKIIRVSIVRDGNGSEVIVGATSVRTEPSAFDKDFKRLRETLA